MTNRSPCLGCRHHLNFHDPEEGACWGNRIGDPKCPCRGFVAVVLPTSRLEGFDVEAAFRAGVRAAQAHLLARAPEKSRWRKEVERLDATWLLRYGEWR